ncbi:MAG: SDR family oxidoreductase [Dehalococcoidia bacterium]
MWGPFDLEGTNAIVTGAARGIGFAIARRLAEAGANVLVADLDGALAADRASEIGAAGFRGKVAALAVDLSDVAAAPHLLEACTVAFGECTLLVNNAGVFPPSTLLEMTPAHFDRVLGLNLRAATFVSQAMASRLVGAEHRGSIVNIASVDAFRPSMVGLAAYDASKAAMVALTKSMALELAPRGIRVNAVAPGGVNTEGARAFQAQFGTRATPAADAPSAPAFVPIPLARMAEPDEIALPVVFLASSAASYITGTTLVVDGGMLLT